MCNNCKYDINGAVALVKPRFTNEIQIFSLMLRGHLCTTNQKCFSENDISILMHYDQYHNRHILEFSNE
jgi:hypothetical protein